jgi:hypothetical protein
VKARGQVLHAALHLLDHQLRDRDGVLCGKVDDLELERSPDTGEIYVTAILAGPGHLLYRLGRRRSGRWRSRLNADLQQSPLSDPSRIPFDRVSSIGPAIDLAVTAADLATHATERWARDHIVGHIPGSRHDADE